MVEAGCHCALVCEEARYLPFILTNGPTNEGGVVEQAILGCLRLLLECSEQCLFGAKDLNSRRWVLGERGK